MRTGKMTWISAGLIVGSLAVGMGFVAVAQDAGPTFYACEKNGSIQASSIHVGSAPECKRGMSLVEWNRQGPPGPQGPQGAPGPAGPEGPTGPQGVSGYEVVLAVSPLDANPNKTAVAYCPEGKNVLGGGVNGVGSSGRIFLSAPNGTGDANGNLNFNRYEGGAVVATGASWRLQVLAVCAFVS